MITIDLNQGTDYYQNVYKVVYTSDMDGLMYQVRLNADSPEEAVAQWEELEIIKHTRKAYRFVEVITEKDWSVE